MWEATSSLHGYRSLNRPAPGHFRSTLLKESAVVGIVAARPSSGPRCRPPRVAPTSGAWPQFCTEGLPSLGPASCSKTHRGGESRVRCIDTQRVAYRASPNLPDIINPLHACGPDFGEEVPVEERVGDWVRTVHGWLPLTFHGRKRFVLLESPDHAALNTELDRAHAEKESAWAQAACLRQELADVRGVCMEKTARIAELRSGAGGASQDATVLTAAMDVAEVLSASANVDTLMELAATTDMEAFIGVGPPTPRSGAVDGNRTQMTGTDICHEDIHKRARAHVDEQVRHQVVVQRRDYSAWPRVRVPVRSTFIQRLGAHWSLALRHWLAAIPELDLEIGHVEVVAIRTRDEELVGFEHRDCSDCRPHPHQHAADHSATIPAVGSLQHMQWYGEITGVQEAISVVELAFLPGRVNTASFLRVLCRRLNRRMLPDGRGGQAGFSSERQLSHHDVSEMSTSDIFPRQVTRIYEWPAQAVPGDTRKPRHVLRENPPSGGGLRSEAIGRNLRQASEPSESLISSLVGKHRSLHVGTASFTTGGQT